MRRNEPTRIITKKCKSCGKPSSAIGMLQYHNDLRQIEGEKWPTREHFFGEDGTPYVYYPVNGYVVYPCRFCGTNNWGVPVVGKFKAEKVCDSKCMGATGPHCECSCGGLNHGGSHG